MDNTFFLGFVVIFWPIFLYMARNNKPLPLFIVYVPITFIIAYGGNYFYPWLGTILAIIFQLVPFVWGFISSSNIGKLAQKNDE